MNQTESANAVIVVVFVTWMVVHPLIAFCPAKPSRAARNCVEVIR